MSFQERVCSFLRLFHSVWRGARVRDPSSPCLFHHRARVGHSVYVCAYERVFHAPAILNSGVKGPGLPRGWGLKNTQEDP